MFHIYFCEGTRRPEAIVFHRRGQFEVKWAHTGAITEEFLRVRPTDNQSFAEFEAQWRADDIKIMLEVRDKKRGCFIPSGLLSVSGTDDRDWKSSRQRLEATIWLLADADRTSATEKTRSELLRWLRGDYAMRGFGDKTVRAFESFVKEFRGPRSEAERGLVAQFVQRLTRLKNLEPLSRLQSYLSASFDPVPPYRRPEWAILEIMQKEMEANPDALLELLEIPRARIPLWGYPAGSLLSTCYVELAYCIEHNIKFRKCQSPGCPTWFALADSRTAKDCHACRRSNATLRSRARKRAEDEVEFKLQWAWRRFNERYRQLNRPPVSLDGYRKMYKPRRIKSAVGRARG